MKRKTRITDEMRLDWLDDCGAWGLRFVEMRHAKWRWSLDMGEGWTPGRKTPRAAIDAAIRASRRSGRKW